MPEAKPIISFGDVDRTTLQNTLPSGSGKVLIRHSIVLTDSLAKESLAW